MALPDISGLTGSELSQLVQLANAELNRLNRLADSTNMVADILVTVHADGGDYVEVSDAALEMAEQRIAAQ
jgi:hypothetical protein